MRLEGRVRSLFEGPNLANLGTLGSDGSPQVTPVWVDYDGEHILINSVEGRTKVENVRRDPRVALSIYSADSLYAPAFVWGRVVSTTTDGAREHINKMSKKYLNRDEYPSQGETRVILKILPEKVRG